MEKIMPAQDIEPRLKELAEEGVIVFCSNCGNGKIHKSGQFNGMTHCRHWQKYFLTKDDFCSHGIPRLAED